MDKDAVPVRGRVTISEVAKAAGVSKATVSRYMGEDRQLLAEATAQRIEAVVERLGYRPNRMASALKRGRTGLVGMLLADIRNPYSVAVMHAVETACRQHGYSLVVCNTDCDDAQERSQLQALQSYNVDGLIVNTLGHRAGELASLARDLPMVLVDRQLAGLPVDLVGLDNSDAVEQALDHLEHNGYRDILAVTEPLDGTSSRQERVDAFQASIARRRGLRGQVLEVGAGLAEQLDAFIAGAGHGPQALFSCNGVATLELVRVLHARGGPLFQDLGLLALDDLDWYPLVGDGISALAQPTGRIGAAAFQCLLERLQGSPLPARRLDLRAQLIARGSTRSQH
ncbi:MULTISPECIES: LacI family DNA-binding transcriptional regulator [unclassified Pseudomonas]|uniref:LacI family DNA-binding transcriptional regulator n=1 Tax=unclassified Pseudomonas TaxID=196821 RepID=UPI000C88EEB0|nr:MULTISPECIES: LacI family DNA-binding transcriptional regulator [unclassified Pseudomonas]PMZ88688.1 transcriptional regulator [Pseudomonas sp. FW305-42]PNA19631.1 transcriptional regulator [Pseudomonas sp. MPR-R1B]PNB19739.1 transcriptional regulator [Pseudomonas sp. DP16D-E2]PNB44632.1 transcriptional regulator [Pseudomonas sp. FW305-17]PNB64859.1 transcriptional regulator [Pseudomonas sp. GW531-E2]